MSDRPQQQVFEALGIPNNSTERLYRLKMIELELETRRQKKPEFSKDSPRKQFDEETERLISLRQTAEELESSKLERERLVLYYNRTAEFYTSKLSQMDTSKLDLLYNQLKATTRSVMAKRKELEKLRKALEVYSNLEPTNEALKQRIDELKKSRLSLEVTFAEEQSRLGHGETYAEEKTLHNLEFTYTEDFNGTC